MDILFTKRHSGKKLAELMFIATVLSIACTGCTGDATVCRLEQEMPAVLSFSWWGTDTTHEYTLNALKMFEKRNQGVNVRPVFSSLDGYDKGIHMASATGRMPDVVQLDYEWLDDCQKKGVFLDIHEVESLIIYQNFSKAELNIGEVDGKLYAVPESLDIPVILWNEEVLAESSLEIPETWDELFAVAEVLEQEGKYALYAETEMLWILALNYMEQLTGKPLADEAPIPETVRKELKELIEVGCRLVESKAVVCGNEEEPDYEKYAGIIVWLNNTEFFTALEESEWKDKIVPGYYFKQQEGKLDSWYVNPSVMYAISKEAENPKESAELVNFLLSGREMVEKQQLDKGVPVSQVARKALLRIGVITQTQYEAGEKDIGIKRMEPLKTALQEEELILAYQQCLQRVMDGKETSADAAGELYVSLDKILRKE